jgi:osmoprotectant transport system ATP-binding protein
MSFENSIVLKNINHHYKKYHAIRDFSFEFENTKVTVIAGRSGSGKSTLLKIINGLISPSSGEAIIFKRRITRTDLIVRQKMGYVIQNVGLFPHMDVGQNISISARISRTKADAGRTDQLLSMVGLPLNFKHKYPHELSGGEQQRVGLCRALYLDPPVLLMDEPMSSLDSITRHALLHHILKLQRTSLRTILYVTHDLRDALLLGDHIIVLDKGSLIQHGSIAHVVQNPSTDIVRELVTASHL